MKHFGGKGEGEGEVGLKWKTSPMLWSALLNHIRSPSHSSRESGITLTHWPPRNLIYLIENFPFTQLRWHWPRDQEKWPNSTGKPSAHLKHQGKSQSWQECRTSRSVCEGEHILKPRRTPEVRDSLGEMWSERSCSSCGLCSLDSVSTEVHLKPGIVTTSSVPSSY